MKPFSYQKAKQEAVLAAIWLGTLLVLLSGQQSVLENVYLAIVSSLAFLVLMGLLIYDDGWGVFKFISKQEFREKELTPTRRVDREYLLRKPTIRRETKDETFHQYTERRREEERQRTSGEYWVECPSCWKRVYGDSLPSLRFVRCYNCDHLIPLEDARIEHSSE